MSAKNQLKIKKNLMYYIIAIVNNGNNYLLDP